MRILHDMALDKDNIVYSLLASTILANLDRPIRDNKFEEKISLNKDIQPLHLPSEISNIELIEAEQKTEEKKEIVLENQPSKEKQTNTVNKLMRRVWYKTRPVSDEGDLPDETTDDKATGDQVEKKTIVPDIDTSHSNTVDNEIIEQQTAAPIPYWINDQVYGDKVSSIPFLKNL